MTKQWFDTTLCVSFYYFILLQHGVTTSEASRAKQGNFDASQRCKESLGMQSSRGQSHDSIPDLARLWSQRVEN